MCCWQRCGLVLCRERAQPGRGAASPPSRVYRRCRRCRCLLHTGHVCALDGPAAVVDPGLPQLAGVPFAGQDDEVRPGWRCSVETQLQGSSEPVPRCAPLCLTPRVSPAPLPSHFMHWFPACVCWAVRWHPSGPLAEHIRSDPAAAAQWASGGVRDLVLIPMLPYLAWALLYYLKVGRTGGTHQQQQQHLNTAGHLLASGRRARVGLGAATPPCLPPALPVAGVCGVVTQDPGAQVRDPVCVQHALPPLPLWRRRAALPAAGAAAGVHGHAPVSYAALRS